MDRGQERHPRSRGGQKEAGRRREIREQLRRGYREMAPINLALAEEGLLEAVAEPQVAATAGRRSRHGQRQVGPG